MTEMPSPDDPSMLPLEERLSLLLDQQLTDPTKSAVLAELESDDRAKALWQRLLHQRSALRAINRQTPATLPASFANRVVDQAIDQARDQGLADDHPLILAAEQPSTHPRRQLARGQSRRMQSRRMMAGLATAAALAATIGGLMFLRDSNAPFASGSPGGGPTDAPVHAASSMLAVDPSLGIVAGVPSPNVPSVPNVSTDALSPSAVAAMPVDSRSSVVAKTDTDDRSAIRTDVASVAPTANGDRAIDVSEVDSAQLPDNTMGEFANRGSTEDKSTIDRSASDGFAGAVMVFEVVCRPGARRNQVFTAAMATAGLRMDAQRQIEDGLVSAAADASGVDRQSDFRIVYLSASAKRIERLYLELLTDRENVDGVGLSLALSAPIVDAARVLAAAADPTLVQDQSVAFEVAARAGGQDLAEDLRDLTFMPMGGGGLGGSGGLVGGSGGDEISPAIFIIR